MPRGYKTRVVYDESNYCSTTICGFFIQGRTSVHRLKVKLHFKTCPICSRLCSVSQLQQEISTDKFEAKRPPNKIERNGFFVNNGMRGCDRWAK